MQILQEHEDLYLDFRRKTLCRRQYYANCLRKIEQRNSWIEGTLMFVTGGTVLGLAFWKLVPNVYLDVTSSVLALLAFLLTNLKGQWKLNNKIDRYKELYHIYYLMNEDFGALVTGARVTKEMTSEEFINKAVEIWNSRRKLPEKDGIKIEEDHQIDILSMVEKYKDQAEKIMKEEGRPEYQSPRERIPQLREVEGQQYGI